MEKPRILIIWKLLAKYWFLIYGHYSRSSGLFLIDDLNEEESEAYVQAMASTVPGEPEGAPRFYIDIDTLKTGFDYSFSIKE